MQKHSVQLSGTHTALREKISNKAVFAALGLALAALLLSAGLIFLLIPGLVNTFHPEFQSAASGAPARIIPGSHFHPVVFGEADVDGSAITISKLAAGQPEKQAILVYRHPIQANAYPFLRITTSGLSPGVRVVLFWQTAKNPGQRHIMELGYAGQGGGIYNLRRENAWRGTVTELAVGLFGDLRGDVVRLDEVVMEPFGRVEVLQAVLNEWQMFNVWTQSSINVYRGAVKDALLPPAPLVTAWTMLAVLLLMPIFSWSRLKRSRDLQALAVISVVALGWLALDMEWTRKLVLQHNESRQLFANKSVHERKLSDWDGELYEFASTIKQRYLPDQRQNIAVLRSPAHGRAYSSRLRYHLLPEHHITWMPVASDLKFALGSRYDYVILLPDTGELQQFLSSPLTAMGLAANGEQTLIYAKGPAALYRVHAREEQDGKTGTEP